MKLLILIVLLIAPITTSFEAIPKYVTPTIYEEMIAPKDYEKVILETLWKNGVSVDLSYIILSQAKHETANFQSNVFKNSNNLFGIKYFKKRKKTTAIGQYRAYCRYKNIIDSTIDYIYYMEKKGIPMHEKSVKSYIDLLKQKKYFEDSTKRYYNAVLKHKKQMYQ